MARPKQIDSLNTRGYTTISVDRATKAQIRSLAGNRELHEFMVELVESYTENKPQAPLGVGSPGSSPVRLPKPLEGKIEGVLDSVSVMLWVYLYLLLGKEAFKPEVNKRVHEVAAAAGHEFSTSFMSNMSKMLTKLLPKGEQAGFNFGEESS